MGINHANLGLHHANRLPAYSLQRVVAFSLLELLGKSLICEDLFLFEGLCRETYLQFYYSLLVNDAAFGLAVVDKEFLVINHYGLSFLDVADEAAVEVRLEIRFLYLF